MHFKPSTHIHLHALSSYLFVISTNTIMNNILITSAITNIIITLQQSSNSNNTTILYSPPIHWYLTQIIPTCVSRCYINQHYNKQNINNKYNCSTKTKQFHLINKLPIPTHPLIHILHTLSACLTAISTSAIALSLCPSIDSISASSSITYIEGGCSSEGVGGWCRRGRGGCAKVYEGVGEMKEVKRGCEW